MPLGYRDAEEFALTDMPHLLDATERDEGFRSLPYRDSLGLWSVGEGRCLERNPLTGAEWKHLLDAGLITISIARAGSDWLVAQQYIVIEARLSEDYATFWPFLNDARKNVLLEMAYQMGVDKEEAFHQTLYAIRDARWADAKAAMLDSVWARQTPKRANTLAEQMFTGEFQ